MSIRSVNLVSATALCLLLAGPAGAEGMFDFENSEAAVSGLNGKIEFSYNQSELDEASGHYDEPSVTAGVSFPVGHHFGFQVDAALMRADSSSTSTTFTGGGAAGHLFWRNPDHALAGIYVHYLDFNVSGTGVDFSVWELGAETELYFNRFTLEGFAGVDYVEGASIDLEYFAGDVFGAYYLNDNLRLHAGAIHRFDQTMAVVGGETMLPLEKNNMSLFADARYGDGVTSVGGGLRIYFGDSGKSLIDRHRQDDPKFRMTNFLGFNIGNDDDAEGCPDGFEEAEDGSCVN